MKRLPFQQSLRRKKPVAASKRQRSAKLEKIEKCCQSRTPASNSSNASASKNDPSAQLFRAGSRARRETTRFSSLRNLASIRWYAIRRFVFVMVLTFKACACPWIFWVAHKARSCTARSFLASLNAFSVAFLLAFWWLPSMFVPRSEPYQQIHFAYVVCHLRVCAFVRFDDLTQAMFCTSFFERIVSI